MELWPMVPVLWALILVGWVLLSRFAREVLGW